MHLLIIATGIGSTGEIHQQITQQPAIKDLVPFELKKHEMWDEYGTWLVRLAYMQYFPSFLTPKMASKI